MREALTRSRLLALFALGWIAFDFPLLTLWDRRLTVFGIPLLPLALFAIWALLIAAVAWVLERDAVAPDAEDEADADAKADAGRNADAAVDAGAAIGPEPVRQVRTGSGEPGRRR
jgi:hypothetical protein